ncbi:vomeronasal type-2 receptor 1-like [Odontesthes bonariensis]
MTMAYAIEEINKNSNLLPNMTLGYSLYDNCGALVIGFSGALSLVSGRDEQFLLQANCSGIPPVLGVVGDSYSTFSIAMSNVLGLFKMPIVSYFSTCSCLSDRQRFPSFFRTIPSDAFQVRAMIQILKHFGWTWVGLLVSDDDYGLHVAQSFQSDLVTSGGGCLAYAEVLPWDSDPGELRRIVHLIKTSTARVVMVFSHEIQLIQLMEEVMRQNVTGQQWISSEAWTSATVLQTPHFMPILSGTLGIAIRRGEITGFKDFLLQIRPGQNDNYRNSMVRQFWEHTFKCKFDPADWMEYEGAICSGKEDIESVETEFLDLSNLGPEYNVYKAVYALAYALDNMLQCEPGRGPFRGHSCATLQNLEPWQLVHYLQMVNFTTSFGDQVSFDENGDALPIYDVMNWLWLPDGKTEVQNVGEVKRSVDRGEELILDEDKIFWNFESKKPPRSVCSDSCPPGTRMARKKGQPECCFDCIPCSEGKISNQFDSSECISCPEDFWSSPQRDRCVPKKTEFLSYQEPLGICLTATSLLGTCICAVVLGIFAYHHSTPVVRANNSELSFLILVSLKLCFLCSLLFIGRPRLWTCQLRHAAFGISFVLCVSCILVKTMVVLAVFKASKPGGGASLKWFGAMQQRGTVLVLTCIQAAICTVWIISASPVPHKNTKYHNDKIVYECDVGSTFGFAVLLSYIGLLAILSFLLAFLARNLPDNFNEAKFITFSMLIFCAVWVAFVPAYINSPGKYADAVEVFAILTSSFGLLVALFGPKCYIILLRPERNTKKAIMGRGTTNFCFIFLYHGSFSLPSACKLRRRFHLNEMHKPGDVVLGGLFEVHYTSVFPEQTFTSEPQQPICKGFDTLGFRHAMTMAFAIEEINNNSDLLPNTTLGYSLYDNCGALVIGFSGALSLVSGRDKQFPLQENCSGTPPVLGIVGDHYSTFSIAIANVLGLYKMSIVSYFATCSCLSDRQRFPTFFRTIPSEAFQVSAMIQILKHFGWTWVGLLVSDDDYGLHVAQSFQSDLVMSGRGCLAYVEVIPWDSDPGELRRIVHLIKTSTARVVIVFAHEIHMIQLMEEVVSQNVTGRQWIASEAWTSASVLQTAHFMPYLSGTLGIAIRRGEIPGLRDFLLHLSPDQNDNSRYNMVRQFWEHTFKCKFDPADWMDNEGAICTGEEDIKGVETEFLDLSNLRPEYNVYKAVYALAYALNDMLQCEPGRGPFRGHSCATLQNMEPWQLVHYLQKVNFSTPFGDQVSFDENGDALPIYDVMNWLWLPGGRIQVQNVGEVRRSASRSEELILNEDEIFWNFKSKEPPRSVCSESCPPGTRIARKKGQPECCFNCIPCSEGKISNRENSLECISCPEDFWSSPQRDHCVPKKTEFLSYQEPLGICMTTTSLLGTCICAVVLGIFTYHRRTPIVRANNSELSFLLLVSLKLCFLCSLLFIGQPKLWTCQLRHAAFGISFVLCVSCILVKTMVVLAVFKASKPGGGASLKWFGAMQQRGTVFVLTCIQAAICTAWLVSASPAPHKNTQYHNDKIVYECLVGSTIGFAILMGYIGFLAILSFLLAFLARNLPNNFNEAKLITFSMLIFCAVWVAFVPAYINSPGKYADAVEVFAILASSFGLLLALFGPKCYIILLRPERNTKKAIMTRGIKS